MPLSNLFHHHRRPPEQVIREMKEHLRQLELSTGILMADLSKLQAAVAAQVGLISAAQTNLNTVEAALAAAAEAGQGGTSQADVDALTSAVEANNAALTALGMPPAAPTPPAPTPAA